jgi:hypothetical protein
MSSSTRAAGRANRRDLRVVLCLRSGWFRVLEPFEDREHAEPLAFTQLVGPRAVLSHGFAHDLALRLAKPRGGATQLLGSRRRA